MMMRPLIIKFLFFVASINNMNGISILEYVSMDKYGTHFDLLAQSNKLYIQILHLSLVQQWE